MKEVSPDSPICEYCARKHFYESDFDDGKCESCLHRNSEYYNANDHLGDHFLGIECIVVEVKE
jgi:hypothetical protein